MLACLANALWGHCTMRICVFCASSSLAPAHFGQAAFDLGQLLANAGVHVVFGGGGKGSMGRLADGVHAAGGAITGVMPHFMRELEWSHPKVSTYEWTTDMAERKARLLADTDAVVALPGGCGTFEELLEVMTLKRLGLYLAPIIVVNQAGFYEPLRQLLQSSIDNRFMDERHQSMYTLVDGVEDVLAAVRSAPQWSRDATGFAVQS